jgi:hypothetical protein
MVALSAAAALRLPVHARLPMQWGPGGKPTWTAPTWLAVSFTPVLAAIVYAATFVAAGAQLSPAIVTILAVQGVVFLVIHAAHLFFAVRSVASER